MGVLDDKVAIVTGSARGLGPAPPPRRGPPRAHGGFQDHDAPLAPPTPARGRGAPPAAPPPSC